jgi:protein phosphatase-4 regulatory subunit 3
LKFFRNLIQLKDEFYNQQMMQERLFEPILNIVIETSSRDNLLNSAFLEFFHYIEQEKIRTLISHIVENYREKIKAITYVSVFEKFSTSYDQSQGFVPSMETSFLKTEENTPKRPGAGRGNRWEGIKDLDAAEEEYFNTSDDEDEPLEKSVPGQASTNGASPLIPLVDYPSDEEGENMDVDANALNPKDSTHDSSSPKDSENDGALTPTSSTAQTPPERLSEKRRREEDEDDEIGKLAQHKRRNSTSSTGSKTNNVLRRKKSFTNSPHGNGATSKSNKIAISLSPAIKTGGDASSGEEGGG